MERHSSDEIDELKFRTYLPWFLIQHGLLLGAGVACIVLAVWTQQLFYLVGLAFFIGWDALLACRYNTEAVIVRGVHLAIRLGTLGVTESSVPIWRLDLVELRQSIVGRLLGYGTVRIYVGSEVVELRRVAPIRLLRTTITARSLALLTATHQHILEYDLTPLWFPQRQREHVHQDAD